MDKARFSHWVSTGIACVLVSLTAACAIFGSRPPEVEVKERAQLRWNALVQGDLKTAYEYFSPGSRMGFQLADFGSSIRIGFWKAVQVDTVECSSPDRCEVTATMDYVHRGMKITTPHRETWIREGSNWWFLRK